MKRSENFTLSKIKLTKKGGLDVTYSETKKDLKNKGITDTIQLNIKNTVNPHPELVEKINELKEYLVKCLGMDTMLVLSKSKGLDDAHTKAFKEVAELMENVHNEQMKKIAITSVSINGSVEDEKDKRSVVISGTQLMENNSKVALNSPRIKLNTDQFKFEADVQDIINELSDEVCAYLFDGKKAQLDMFKEEAPKLNENFIKGNLKDADGNPIEKVEAVA